MNPFRSRHTAAILAIAAATLTLVACSTPSRVTFKPNAPATLPDSGRTVAPLEMRQNIPFAHVTINGRGPWLFAVDTGANVTVLAHTLAEELTECGAGRLTRYDASARCAAGDDVGIQGVFPVNHLAIGDAAFGGFHAAVLDLDPVRNALGEDVMGILGFSLFRDCLVTIDYPANQLILERGSLPHPDDIDVLTMRLSDGLPVLSTRFGDHPVALVVDSGSDHAFALPGRMQDVLTFHHPPQPGPWAATISGVSQRLVGRIHEDVAIGPWAVADPEIMLTQGRGRIGGPLLRQFAVTFDQQTGAMRLTRPAPTTPAAATLVEVPITN